MSPNAPESGPSEGRELPTPPREVSEESLAEGIELEVEVVHKLEIDPGFMFSA